jgi:ABC-2 type transport system permease protein
LFLVPAITMRSISEERRTGTLEILLTKPLTELQVVLAKYIACLLLVAVALLPTLVYWYTISDLALPQGNVDTGGILGSYIGLLFLAACFVAVGIFASALTESQIVAFLIAVFLSFFLYLGFELLADYSTFGGLEGAVRRLGIQEHYMSMSRGVIDLRDALYFVGVIGLFLLLTRTVLQSRTWS